MTACRSRSTVHARCWSNMSKLAGLAVRLAVVSMIIVAKTRFQRVKRTFDFCKAGVQHRLFCFGQGDLVEITDVSHLNGPQAA